MFDEELRSLERESQAHADDVDLGWRYARALERAGDRRSFLVEASRLARLGHPEAKATTRDVVALSTQGPQRSRGRRCRPLREPWRLREGSVDCPHQAIVLAATEEVLYIQNDEALVAVDTRRLVELWRRRRPLNRTGAFGLRGEDVVVSDDRDLVVLDGRTGTEITRSRQLGTITEIAAEGDRAVLQVAANDERLWLLVGVDFGRAFGRQLWKQISQRPDEARTMGILEDYVLIGPVMHASALHVEDGRAESGRFARRLTYHGDLGRMIRRLTVQFGSVRFAIAQTHETSQPADDFTGLEIFRDSTRRRVDIPPLQTPSQVPGAFQRYGWSLSLAGDQLGYAVSVPFLDGGSGEGNFVNVLAVDLESARLRLNVGLPVDLHGEFHSVQGIALDGALLVVVTTPARCTLLRLEGS